MITMFICTIIINLSLYIYIYIERERDVKCIKYDFWGWGLSAWPLEPVLRDHLREYNSYDLRQFNMVKISRGILVCVHKVF